MITAGWDIGGAHLKVAVAQGGRIVAAFQAACPVWRGLAELDAAFVRLKRELAGAGWSHIDRHACTMTAELSDVFVSRAAGVAALAQIAAQHLGACSFYAGNAGFVALAQVGQHSAAIASANWHATAALVGQRCGNAILIDIGSTTTDIVPVLAGKVAAQGFDDAGRLQAGELVYTGIVRSFCMAVADAVPFQGALTPLCNEYFANMADVYRVLELLPEGADAHATADGRAATLEASRARLARMIGRDADEGSAQDWHGLALAFKRSQLRTIERGLLQVASRQLPGDAPLVAAGAGAFLVTQLAQGLGRQCRAFTALLPCDPLVAPMASTCAPASALALLVAAPLD